MSTSGYGDISFTSDPGRLSSLLVLLSVIILILVLLPLAFIELFSEPWMKSREANFVSRSVSAIMQDHIIPTFYDPFASGLIEKHDGPEGASKLLNRQALSMPIINQELLS